MVDILSLIAILYYIGCGGIWLYFGITDSVYHKLVVSLLKNWHMCMVIAYNHI